MPLADARAETPGETLLRLLWHLAGLPELDLQVEVVLDSGALARLDALLFAGDLALEFDGRLKYRAGEGRTPQQVSDILWAEKLRHDALVRLGLRVERFIWAELMAPGRTTARMRSLAREVLGPRLVPLLGE